MSELLSLDINYEKAGAFEVAQKVMLEAGMEAVKAMSDYGQLTFAQEKSMTFAIAKAVKDMTCDDECKEYEVAKALDYSGNYDEGVEQSLDKKVHDQSLKLREAVEKSLCFSMVEKAFMPWKAGEAFSSVEDSEDYIAAHLLGEYPLTYTPETALIGARNAMKQLLEVAMA
jgi:hypothetical protein